MAKALATKPDIHQPEANDAQEQADVPIQQVAIKLPQFWDWHPESWFIYVESQFQIRNIVIDATKFAYTVQALSPETCRDLSLYLEAAPAADKYEYLKRLLIRTYGLTKAEKGKQLLSLPNIEMQGDGKASTMARRVCELATDLDDIRQAILLDRLPPSVQSILATQRYDNVIVLAENADRILEAQRKREEVRQVTEAVAEINLKHKFKARKLPDKKPEQGSWVCGFHKQYGHNARRCKPGCVFDKTKPGNDRA